MLPEGANVDQQSAVAVVAVDDPDEEEKGFRRISRIDLVVKSRNQYPAYSPNPKAFATFAGRTNLKGAEF